MADLPSSRVHGSGVGNCVKHVTLKACGKRAQRLEFEGRFGSAAAVELGPVSKVWCYVIAVAGPQDPPFVALLFSVAGISGGGSLVQNVSRAWRGTRMSRSESPTPEYLAYRVADARAAERGEPFTAAISPPAGLVSP
jgi:hypothetical protein